MMRRQSMSDCRRSATSGSKLTDSRYIWPGPHDQGMVADEVLEVVDLAVVRPVGGVGADDLGVLPGGLKSSRTTVQRWPWGRATCVSTVGSMVTPEGSVLMRL